MNTSSVHCGISSTTSPRTGRSKGLATLPLLSHSQPDAIVAYRSGRAVLARHFIADVTRVAAALPAGDHVINVCTDRYRFTVGFAAGLMAHKISLLPSTHAPEAIRQLKAFAQDVFCLTDDPQCEIDLPKLLYPEGSGEATTGDPSWGAQETWQCPEIDADQLAAYVFTSGSTGTPLPYKKTWGRLLRCVHDGASRLGLLDGRSHAILGTVPPQHMYGFESSVLLGLQSSSALCAERPFYPADICSTLAAVPRPRVLISTPIHLRALLTAAVALPDTDLIVSATAPLSQDLAREVEQRFATRLLEIYGSTETGQIATRRTAHTLEWRLWPGVSLTLQDGQAWAQGGHIEQPTPMCDVLELQGEDRFLLHGRMADLVNIAGKRSSLAYLNHQLNSIHGVIDGTFFLPDETHASSAAVTRVAAFVVAPGLTGTGLTDELRKRIDPVFLPRPLLFVDRLPRNGTGKLPHAALRALAAAHLRPAP